MSASPEAALAYVRAVDPMVDAFVERAGAPEPRSRQGDPLASLARAIVFQQLATRAAAAIHARFVSAIGGAVTPGAILATPPEILRAAGLSTAKARSLLDLAEKVADGSVPLDDLGPLPDDDIVERLTTVRGIGRWTAEMFLLFELRRPDVWPVDDLGVRHGWRVIHEQDDLVPPKELLVLGEPFRPFRSTLALLCYHAVHVSRGTSPAP
jgi:DNA-3-methyladenine glycosylase II